MSNVVKPTLLPTKLYPPSLPPTWVQRWPLNQRLNGGLQLNRQVTLVSAPAGFGKTTCINDWVNSLNDWPFTWLCLDPSDDDPNRFFTYFIAALQKVNPNLGREIEAVILAGSLPPGEIITATIIKDILECADRFLLILDDFHVIQDPFILEVLEKLIANLPQALHLVLLTREDPPLPLAQLRANNLLTEIRAKDLRFTGDDTNRFLDDVMGLSLSPTDTATLEDKTEGWIVGLQLAAIALQSQQASLSVRDPVSPSRWIATLSGSHRYILNYLTEQVLDRQPEEIRQFLLQTSILDRLNGDLCNAVTGRSDSHALLEKLFAANLFLIPLDDEGKWYRYHHLFADLLRDLQSTHQIGKIAELQQRASYWYAGADMMSEAIQHALGAGDYAMAVDLLEGHAKEMIMQGYVKTVSAWVQAIPAEWASQSPRTHLAFAWMHALGGTYAQITPYLEQLQAILENTKIESQLTEEYSSLRSEWFVLQSMMLYMQGKTAECMDMATRSLELAPGQDNRVRSLAYYVQASACWAMQDYPRAIKIYQMSIQYGRAAENLIAEIMSTVGLAGMLLEHGQLHQAFEIASQAVDRVERSGKLPPISAVVYASLGDAYYQWHQIEDARHYFQRAVRLSILGGSNTITILCRVRLSRLYYIDGNLDAAVSEIQQAADLVPVEVPDYVQQEVLTQQVRIYLAQNRIVAAQMALQSQMFSFQEGFSFPELPADQSITYSVGLLYNSSLRVLLYQTKTKNELSVLRPGLELANHLIARALQSQQLLVALEALILRAQLHAKLGDHQGSQADYMHALGLAEPEGFIGVFVEQDPAVADALADLLEQSRPGTVQAGYLERILVAFARLPQRAGARIRKSLGSSSSVSRPENLIEPLTDRELDVLRLMTKGLKYKEISARLYISLNTVRSHTKSIYGKLNVSNRTKAIEKARQLQIL